MSYNKVGAVYISKLVRIFKGDAIILCLILYDSSCFCAHALNSKGNKSLFRFLNTDSISEIK